MATPEKSIEKQLQKINESLASYKGKLSNRILVMQVIEQLAQTLRVDLPDDIDIKNLASEIDRLYTEYQTIVQSSMRTSTLDCLWVIRRPYISLLGKKLTNEWEFTTTLKNAVLRGINEGHLNAQVLFISDDEEMKNALMRARTIGLTLADQIVDACKKMR